MYNATDNAVQTSAGTQAGYGGCDVCRLVDGDQQPKAVEWCGLCKAWICGHCRTNWARRVSAFFAARRGR